MIIKCSTHTCSPGEVKIQTGDRQMTLKVTVAKFQLITKSAK